MLAATVRNHFVEHSHGVITRSGRLPEAADTVGSSSGYTPGVVTVTFTKREPPAASGSPQWDRRDGKVSSKEANLMVTQPGEELKALLLRTCANGQGTDGPGGSMCACVNVEPHKCRMVQL